MSAGLFYGCFEQKTIKNRYGSGGEKYAFSPLFIGVSDVLWCIIHGLYAMKPYGCREIAKFVENRFDVWCPDLVLSLINTLKYRKCKSDIQNKIHNYEQNNK